MDAELFPRARRPVAPGAVHGQARARPSADVEPYGGDLFAGGPAPEPIMGDSPS